jgi:multiple sugar transport system permease protein
MQRDSAALTSGVTSASHDERRAAAREARTGWLLTAPALALCALLVVYPFAYNVWLSFLNRTARRRGEFVAFDTYVRLFSDSDLYWTAARTAVWTAGTVAGQIVLGLTLAVILDREFGGRGLLRSALLVPYALSTVTVVYIWRWMLNDINGVANFTLMSIGAIGSPIVFLSGPVSSMITVIVVAIWQAMPFTVLLLLAGLQSIPKELYDACSVDGGSRWTEFRHVTLPLLRPVLATIVLIKTIWTFNWFDLIWLFTGGGPADATRTFAVAVYEEGFRKFQISEAAGIGVLMLLCVAGLVAPLMRQAERNT